MNRIQRQKEYFNDVTEKWIKVNKYLEMIFIDRTPLDGKKMMEFHQLVYYHCCCFSEDPGVKSQDAGTSFYDSTIRFLNERLWVVSRELELITNNEQLLIKYLEHWDMYRKSCEVLNCGCRFFNQNWVRFENSGKRVDIVHDIYRTAIIQWMDVVFRPVDRSLVNAITSLIRRTDQQERIHMVLQSIVELYANDENQTVSVPNKLNNVFDTAVVDLYKRRTFIKFQKTLGSNGFTDFRHFLKYACLAMPEIEKGNQFKDFLKSHITHKLNEAVRKSPRCKDSKIEAILAVRNSRLGRSIGGHKELKDIMNKSVAVILAKYGDDLMKDKKVEEADLKNEYQQIVKIVESMNEIKLFIRRYRDYLRSRLIGETCVSLNRESMMVGWLTDKFGDETIILRIFLINFQTSNSFNDQLQAYLSTRNLGFEFHLNYFKQDRMEVVENFNLVLPWEIQQAVEELRQYQFIKHPRKKIEFDFSNSFGIITYNLGESSYNFSVNTFQMVILMQFNIFQRLTIEQLLGNLNMTLDILEWAMDTLISYKVLIRRRSSNKLADIVEVNDNFNSRKRQVNININSKAKLRRMRKIQLPEIQKNL